jgi:hypothetical protein
MKKFIIIVTSLFPMYLLADFSEAQGQMINAKNENTLYYLSLPYAIARQGQRAVDSESLVVGFSKIDDRVYSVSDKLQVVSTRIEGRLVISTWPATRWEYEFNEDTDIFYTNADLSGSELTKHYNQFISENQNDLGCLVNTPLRYGKISQSSDSDVVLTIGTLDTQADLIVFSPTYERIVFSLRYAEQNSAKAEAVAPFQYIQTTNYHAEQQAYRTYGKVYEGDFDQDGHADLITWRKIFYSHETDSTELGFFAGGEILTHYERDLEVQAASPAGITGEYLPQDTPEADIQNFLAENNLTWSKGYPSKSECAGEEGQLIPEMHDPLLNDPEVLE